MEELLVAIFILAIARICNKSEQRNRLALGEKLKEDHDAWSRDISYLIEESKKNNDREERFREQLSSERKKEREEMLNMHKKILKKNK